MSSISQHTHAGQPPLALAIGREVRRRRLALGLSQGSLGRPHTRSFVSSVEHGRCVPSVVTLAALAERLGTTLEEFFRGVNREMTGSYTSGHECHPNSPPRRRR